MDMEFSKVDNSLYPWMICKSDSISPVQNHSIQTLARKMPAFAHKTVGKVCCERVSGENMSIGTVPMAQVRTNMPRRRGRANDLGLVATSQSLCYHHAQATPA